MIPNGDDPRWNYLREQIRSTSIHGIPKIFGSHFAITKIVWVVVFIVATIACGGHGYMLFKQFFDYPTKVQMTLKSAERQIFPSVTICNLNPAYRSKLLCTNYELATIDEYMPDLIASKAISSGITRVRVQTNPQSTKCDNKTDPKNETLSNRGVTTSLSNVSSSTRGKQHSRFRRQNDECDDGGNPFQRSDCGKCDSTGCTQEHECKNLGCCWKPIISTVPGKKKIASCFNKFEKAAGKRREKRSLDPKGTTTSEDSPGLVKNAAGITELTPEAKEAVQQALQKMSSAESPSAKMIVDKLLHPSQPKDGISAKDKISSVLQKNVEFTDNFGSLMNAAKYKSQLVDYIQKYEMNIYQAALRSLQTEDLSDVHDLIHLSEDEIQQVAVPIEEFIRECTYNGLNCNFTEDFHQIYNKKFGYCYTFNSGLNGRPVKSQLGWGSQTGLRLTLNIESNEYVGVLASEYGARVTIHAPGELSNPQSDGFNVGIGRVNEIGVRYREQFRLSAPYESNCTTDFPKEYVDQQLIPPNINYTLTTCKMACTDFYLKQKCGCVHYSPEIKTVPQCYLLDEEQTWCRIDVLSKLRALNESDILECPCNAPCYERFYDTQIASTHWPSYGHKQMRVDNFWKSNSIAEKLIDSVAKGDISLTTEYELSEDKDLMRIHVYFLDLNYESIIQEAEYEWIDLMADVGGILGLYIGMSLLSIGEVIEIIMTWYYIKATIAQERKKEEIRSRSIYHSNHPQIFMKAKLL